MNYPRNPQRRMNNFNESAQNRQRNGYQNQGQNRPGKYEPGKATLRPNHEKRGPRDPDYKGVVTIDQPGVWFISGWYNKYDDGNEAIRLSMNHADASQGQGRPQQPRNGGYRQQQGQGSYEQPQNYQRQPQRPQGGAMSRARPIPSQQYREEGPYDNAPPPNEYPEQAEQYNVRYDDNEEIPF